MFGCRDDFGLERANVIWFPAPQRKSPERNTYTLRSYRTTLAWRFRMAGDVWSALLGRWARYTAGWSTVYFGLYCQRTVARCRSLVRGGSSRMRVWRRWSGSWFLQQSEYFNIQGRDTIRDDMIRYIAMYRTSTCSGDGWTLSDQPRACFSRLWCIDKMNNIWI